MKLQVLCLSLCNLAIITSVAPILLFLLQWSDILQHYTLPAVIQTAVNVNLSFIVRGQHQGFVPIKWFSTLLHWGQLETCFCLITAVPRLFSGIWSCFGWKIWKQPSNWTNFNKTQTLAMQRLMANVTNTADGGRGNVLCVCVCSTAS